MTCRFCERRNELSTMNANVLMEGTECEEGISGIHAARLSAARLKASDALRYLIYMLEEVGRRTCSECAGAHKFHFPTADKEP